MATDQIDDTSTLFERLCNPILLGFGFADVKKNRGAPGIDGVTIGDFEQNLEEELARLSQELEGWRYQPRPVRRVEIEKPDGGRRKLGIPCIRDRVVQATLKRILEPILTPHFSAHSFGFVPGRNQEQAVQQAQQLVAGGKDWVVDIDLAQFFDRVHHDRLITRLGQRIDDKRILRLIGMTLRSGVMQDGLVSPTPEGTVQGSPLSPLLSNVVLDELDKELEVRQLAFCRYADDCNIFVSSRKAADRAMVNISRFIETRLKLEVNRDKSQVARSGQVRFLGMTIVDGHVAISAKSMKYALQRVRELTPRGTHLTLEATMAAINRWYRGWSAYYSMTDFPSQLRTIEARIRRRLRARLVDQQKSRRNLYRKLWQRGVPRSLAARTAYSHHRRWALSHTLAVERAFPNRWFIAELGQYTRSAHRLRHWFALDVWIRLV